MAPSADIGDDHALFQPCHGSAPDIAGQGQGQPDRDDPVGGDDAGLARPSAAQDRASPMRPAELERAVDGAFAAGLRTADIGGKDGTAAVARAVLAGIGG